MLTNESTNRERKMQLWKTQPRKTRPRKARPRKTQLWKMQLWKTQPPEIQLPTQIQRNSKGIIECAKHLAFTTGVTARNVTVDGEVVLRDGATTRVDPDEVRARAAEQARRLFRRMEDLPT